MSWAWVLLLLLDILSIFAEMPFETTDKVGSVTMQGEVALTGDVGTSGELGHHVGVHRDHDFFLLRLFCEVPSLV